MSTARQKSRHDGAVQFSVDLRDLIDAPGLDRIAAGATNHQIADSLGISIKTVQNHVSRSLDKLQATDRTQAALRARSISPPLP